MINMNDLKNYANGFATGRLRFLAEKVTWHMHGHCKINACIRCSLFTYDESGMETLVYSKDVLASSDGTIQFSYNFDPISLAVYQNAVEFRAAVCPVTDDAELILTEFSLVEEQPELQYKSEEYICNLVIDKDGTRAVSVLQTDGENITVPLIPKKVLFVGNSILLGMNNAYGMCASSPQKDYFHYVSEAIKKKSPACIFLKLHGAGFEHAENAEMFENWYSKEINAYTGQPPAEESFTEDLDLVILQLTDNINNPSKTEAFVYNIDTLLKRIKLRCPRARLLWIHGWYQRGNTTIYKKLLEVCRRWKIERIDISDLKSKENEAFMGQTYIDVNGNQEVVKEMWISHPGDVGMKKIADRIIDVLGI